VVHITTSSFPTAAPSFCSATIKKFAVQNSAALCRTSQRQAFAHALLSMAALEQPGPTEGGSDAMPEAGHPLPALSAPLQDALQALPGALSTAASSSPTSKVEGHDGPSEMLDDVDFGARHEVIVIGSSDDEDASEPKGSPSPSMAHSAPSLEAASSAATAASVAASASAAASASTAAEREDDANPVAARNRSGTSNPTCAKCQRVFRPKQRGAMVTHQKSCTGEAWAARAKLDRAPSAQRPAGSQARNQLLNSQGYEMQWNSANRSVAAASAAIAQDPERASKLTRAKTKAACAGAAQGGVAGGALPFGGAPRNAAERLHSTKTQPALTWFSKNTDAGADGGAPAGTSAGAAVVKLPTWAIAVPRRRGFAIVSGGHRTIADGVGQGAGGMAGQENVAICSRVGPEYQAEIPPLRGSATDDAASSSLGEGVEEELHGPASLLVRVETREIEREMAVAAAKHLTATAYEVHPAYAPPVSSRYAAPPPAFARDDGMDLANDQCGACGRMCGNRGATVFHEKTCAARAAAGLPPAGDRRLSKGERTLDNLAKRRHASASAKERKGDAGEPGATGTNLQRHDTAAEKAGRAAGAGSATRKQPKRPRLQNGCKAGPSAAVGEAGPAYAVERLCGQRVVDLGAVRQLQYLVRWSGCGAEEDTWEEQADILDPELVRAFLDKCDGLRRTTLGTPPLASPLGDSIDLD